MERLDHKRLAEGEVTGHYHEATSLTAELFADGDEMDLMAPNGTDVTHQEHGTISVPPGEYTRHIVQEFDPFAEEIRNVAD